MIETLKYPLDGDVRQNLKDMEQFLFVMFSMNDVEIERTMKRFALVLLECLKIENVNEYQETMVEDFLNSSSFDNVPKPLVNQNYSTLFRALYLLVKGFRQRLDDSDHELMHLHFDYNTSVWFSNDYRFLVVQI